MTTCRTERTDWLAFLLEDLEEGRRESLAEHLEECPECRKEVAELRRVLKEADSVKDEIRDRFMAPSPIAESGDDNWHDAPP